ncbi:type II secretion system protein [Vibrio sp. 1CM23M]|uniref:pilus assembly FimT family protein n=1 Tax=Vibrio sp. 1CM23M TaxID=2929164 RepID=UPI0020C09B58|nr:type II secretion system protein [Vibrio sp. 1CM23M]MCK8072426.1 type II secretion system GspH family protein [Vibrio sp. 1CM23M]
MNLKVQRKIGFTLIETLAAVAVGGSLAAAGIQSKIESDKDEFAKTKGIELAKVLSAIDNRIATDGYEISLWNKKTWNKATFNNLLEKQLNATDKRCGVTDWSPTNATDANLQSLDCKSMWTKTPFDMNLSARISADSSNINIDNFDLLMSFKDAEHFKNEFKNVAKMVRSARSTNLTGSAFEHNIGFVNSATKMPLTRTECISLAENCSVLANANRAGGSEYVRADGSRSMVDSHLSFVDAKGNSPLKCVRWRKESGVWGMITPNGSSTDENCGIGIYKKANQPLIAEVLAENGTFENIMLDKECDMLGFDSATKLVTTTATRTPCGLRTESQSGVVEAIQVIDNTMSNRALIKNLYSNNTQISTLNVSSSAAIENLKVDGSFEVLVDAIMKDIDVQNANVNGTLKVFGTTTLGTTTVNDLNVLTTSNFKGDAKFKNMEVKGFMKADVISARKVVATSGSFNNYNSKISSLQNKIKTLEAKISTASTPDYSTLKAQCNRRPDIRLSSDKRDCTGHKREGDVYFDNMLDYYWVSGSNFCGIKSYEKITASYCKREHK